MSKQHEEQLKLAQKEIDSLRRELSRLELLTMSLWETLKAKNPDFSDASLLERMNEIDMRDGVVTGEATKAPDLCPTCQRPVSVRTQICIYCGIHVPRKTPF